MTNPYLLNGQTLAYVGDAVYELHVRKHLVERGNVKPNRLHRAAVRYVSAKMQAKIIQSLHDQLDETEKEIVRRGRNAKTGTVPKHATPGDYRQSTAFESLLGYLYLTGRKERLAQIVARAIAFVENENTQQS